MAVIIKITDNGKKFTGTPIYFYKKYIFKKMNHRKIMFLMILLKLYQN